MQAYPFRKYNYQVEVKNLGIMWFSEMSGGDLSLEPIEYSEIVSNHFTRHQGLNQYSNIVMKHGKTTIQALYDWLKTSQKEVIRHEDISISLLDDQQTILTIWHLTNAWPVKVIVSDMPSSNQEIALETIEFAYEKMIRE